MSLQTQQRRDLPEEEARDILRCETVLSRYPIHRLSNKGLVNIDIRKRDASGTVTFLWEVSHNSRYGQPGPLAYKLDTLVINRRIDEAGRPIPKLLRLGSLAEIARELDLGADTNKVKRALRQNAFAGITAKTTYRGQDGQSYSFEFSDTRYGVIFTGETLPDGTRADSVFLLFHDLYLEVLNRAPRRPLDYEYLRGLPPAPQRFYEIVSYAMFPAIKYGHRARLAYSDFCLYSTVTRYFEFDQVKKQMYKIHLPHLRAGYIARIEYETTLDDEGRADWNMFYTPGETAKRQQLVFDFALSTPRRARGKKTAPPRAPRSARSPEGQAPPAQLPLPEPGEAPQSAPAAEKWVRTFYQLRYGQEQTPTEREVGEAAQYLTEGEAWTQYLVAYAAEKGKETNGFPNDFGGIKKLISQARGPYASRRAEREAEALKKGRQSHEKAYRSDYLVFLGELLQGKLKTSLPEAFRVFCMEEERDYKFYKNRAAKEGASERARQDAASFYEEENRIRRLEEFLKRYPKSGIPDFWQWDEEFNSNPFRRDG